MGQDATEQAARKSGKMAPGGPVPGSTPVVSGAPGMPPTPGDAKPGDAKPGDAKPAENAPPEAIKRKSEPPEAPNKREFDVKPDDQGMLQFQFRNQAWPDLLRWLSEVSNMSLDWQELPGDYLNLSTQRKHSLEETRDLFNRHLLARGFTILEFDGILQVSKTKGINTSQVPKVDVSKLDSLPPHRFVRVSFSLNSLIAADVVSELKPLISGNGDLHALAATNRLEAMDTAANLSELNRILNEEQSQSTLEGLAREFVLEYVRANDAKDQLRQFLGLETAKKSGPMTPEEQMAAQQQQMMMQQQQQQRQQQGLPAPPKTKDKGDIYLVANARRNSVIASAPPDKMAIIAAFVRRIDVANENADSMSMLEARMKVYRLSSLDPKQLVASLLSMDVLEPTTRLEVDEKNKAVIAHASIADQYAIQQTIKRLDGSARDVDVIQLRRLRAEDVVGTIKFLMGTDEKKDDNSRRNYGYDPWGYSSSSKKETSTDAFRVAANSQDNQVLIWANELERSEVNKLLVKLGELPPAGGNASRVRVIDANRSSDTKEYLKRLQQAWSKISPTPLVLPSEEQFDPADAKKSPAAEAESKETDKPKTPRDPKEKAQDISVKTANTPDEKLARIGVPTGFLSSANQVSGSEPNGDEKSNATKPNPSTARTANPQVETDSVFADKDRADKTPQPSVPIQIAFDERGNLVLTGDDTEALSRLEQMMIDNAPPQRNYEVYYIKNSKPTWVKWNLEDYYKEDKKDSNNDAFRWIFGIDAPSDKKNDDPQLSKKRKLKFLSDNDTNSLIVIGADDVQLKTIEELIRLWDVPEKTNKQKLRYSKLVHVDFSKADVVVDAIKEAYRDLLSTNDKAFEKEKSGGGGEGGGKESKRGSSSDSIFEGGMSYSFSGRLSMGVDKITNSIIVSAEGEDLLKLVCEMINELDEAAKPTGSIEVIKLDGANGAAMEKALTALAKANGKDVKNGDPNQQQQQLNQQQMNQQQQENMNGQPPNASRSRKK